MIYAEITYLKSENSQDKINFDMYGAPNELIEDYLATKDDWKRSHEDHFCKEEKYYLTKKDLPLIFLAKYDFIPLTENFFFLKKY